MKEEQPKNLVESAVPKPPLDELSEAERKALEISGQIEHAHGREREKLEEDAESLGGAPAETQSSSASKTGPKK